MQGAAGTGKTVLLSHLFYRISTEINFDDADYVDMISNLMVRGQGRLDIIVWETHIFW